MRYQRGYVVGHSNRGNVDLVTAREHPDVIQTCVLQAANAFVSFFLIELEPEVFDPQRMVREFPQWMEEMIRLHSQVNGSGYWRDLLRMTLEEIISEPNYTPGDLARVEKPILVIMGAEDAVNAPEGHIQFIAGNIPGAECWIPENTGHNVYKERPEEWLAKVLDFLTRHDSRSKSTSDSLGPTGGFGKQSITWVGQSSYGIPSGGIRGVRGGQN